MSSLLLSCFCVASTLWVFWFFCFSLYHELIQLNFGFQGRMQEIVRSINASFKLMVGEWGASMLCEETLNSLLWGWGVPRFGVLVLFHGVKAPTHNRLQTPGGATVTAGFRRDAHKPGPAGPTAPLGGFCDGNHKAAATPGLLPLPSLRIGDLAFLKSTQ